MPKLKLSPAKIIQLTREWHDHNRWLKQHHMPKQTFDEYVDSVFGLKKVSRKSAPKTGPKFPTYKKQENKYPSADMRKANPNATARNESPVYSGTLIKGICTMHKSNAVPVINQDEMEDIAKMRRN
jgi:hypothetical protein